MKQHAKENTTVSAEIVSLDAIERPSISQTSHLKNTHHKSFVDKLFGVAGAASVGLAFTPLAMRQLGIGLDHKALDGACCEIIKNAAAGHKGLIHKDWNIHLDNSSKPAETTYGIAGWASGALSHVPFGEEMFKVEKNILSRLESVSLVKEGTAQELDSHVDKLHPLARGGLMNALAAGGIVLLGHFGGAAINHQHQKHLDEQDLSTEEREARRNEKSALGRIVQDGSKLLGLGVLAPAVLPGVGHALLSISATAGLDKIDYDNFKGDGPITKLAAVLGKNPGTCKRTGKLYDAIEGSSSALLSQLCCAVPAITAAMPALLHSAIANDNISVSLPSDISPYDKKNHSEEPDKKALSYLNVEELQQRIRENNYHIEDTHNAQESSKQLRTALKLGTATLASVGSAALASKLFLQKTDEKTALFDNAVKDAQTAPNPDGEFHTIRETDTGNRYIGIKFPKDYEGDIEQALHGQNALKNDNIPIEQPQNPIKIALQKAGCAFNDQKTPIGAICAGFETLCCNTIYYSKPAVDNIIGAAKGLTGSDITTNQAMTIGGVSALLGAIVYNVTERIVDSPATNKIAMLERENNVLESILETKQNMASGSFAEKLVEQRTHDDPSFSLSA